MLVRFWRTVIPVQLSTTSVYHLRENFLSAKTDSPSVSFPSPFPHEAGLNHNHQTAVQMPQLMLRLKPKSTVMEVESKELTLSVHNLWEVLKMIWFKMWMCPNAKWVYANRGCSYANSFLLLWPLGDCYVTEEKLQPKPRGNQRAPTRLWVLFVPLCLMGCYPRKCNATEGRYNRGFLLVASWVLEENLS